MYPLKNSKLNTVISVKIEGFEASAKGDFLSGITFSNYQDTGYLQEDVLFFWVVSC